MEMESSRRSAMDRPREHGAKKPRLTDEAERPTKVSGGCGTGSQPVNTRFKAVDRERDEREDSASARGAASYQQQQELVAQYKTALAELTFNSKPIITNLTIIAGENLHAAKAIAATVCNNILEVPSEQKLPSLYLLDSIVKNIGRDYIKYFAARLPEVFCKAYKQVDSSIHPGMRHLFGTWKGVFPPAPLQIIEKDLGFPAVANGSSGAAASRPDSQTQRPPHSIHVNPKYLEARQLLQQSTKAKEASSNDNRSMIARDESAERSDRAASVRGTRQWAELPTKIPNMQRPQREVTETILEKKGFREYDLSSDTSRHPDLGLGKVSEREKLRDGHEKSWYGAVSKAAETSASRRDNVDVKNDHAKFREPGFVQGGRQLLPVHLTDENKSSRISSKNWKNSEEEEFMWDEVHSRITDYGGTSSSQNVGRNSEDVDRSSSLLRGKWMPLETEILDTQSSKIDPFSRTLKASRGEDIFRVSREVGEHLPRPDQTSSNSLIHQGLLGHHTSSVWPPRESPSATVNFDYTSSRASGMSEGQAISHEGALSPRFPMSGLLPQSVPSDTGPLMNVLPGTRGLFGQQPQQPLRPPLPSPHIPPISVPLQNPKSQTSADHDLLKTHYMSRTGPSPMQHSGDLIRAPHGTTPQDSFSTLSHDHSPQPHTLLDAHSQPAPQASEYLQLSSAASTALSQLSHHLPLLQQLQPDLLQRQTQSSHQATQNRKAPIMPPSFGSHQTGRFSGTSHSNISAVDVSGQSSTSNLLDSIMKTGLPPSQPTRDFQNPKIQPPLPSGPPPTHALTSSSPLVTPSSFSSNSHSSTSVLTPPSATDVLPPLPPGPPPPSSLLGTSVKLSNTASDASNPLSSLLSSLVAKGLISSPATDVLTAPSVQIPDQLSNQSSGSASSTSMSVPFNSASMKNSAVSLAKGEATPELFTAVDSASLQSVTKTRELLGIDFKPEIIRELHPLVIDSLYDDIKHQCNKCGLRFELEEQLQSHLDWHASQKPERNTNNRISQRWFADIDNWVAGRVRSPSEIFSTTFEDAVLAAEVCEPMVPADESQCICALCGEPFEDIYSHEKDEWLYRGTVYLNLMDTKGGKAISDGSIEHGPIVHAKCTSESSADGMEVTEHKDDGLAES